MHYPDGASLSEIFRISYSEILICTALSRGHNLTSINSHLSSWKGIVS